MYNGDALEDILNGDNNVEIEEKNKTVDKELGTEKNEEVQQTIIITEKIERLEETVRLLTIEVDYLKKQLETTEVIEENNTPTIEEIPKVIEVLPIKKSRFI